MSSTDFSQSVLSLTAKIPRGKITTYKRLAEKLGKPQASRAVGNALNKNTKPVVIPCHRVVKSDGKIGGYALGVKKKKTLLSSEGIEIKDNKIINISEFLW